MARFLVAFALLLVGGTVACLFARWQNAQPPARGATPQAWADWVQAANPNGMSMRRMMASGTPQEWFLEHLEVRSQAEVERRLALADANRGFGPNENLRMWIYIGLAEARAKPFTPAPDRDACRTMCRELSHSLHTLRLENDAEIWARVAPTYVKALRLVGRDRRAAAEFEHFLEVVKGRDDPFMFGGGLDLDDYFQACEQLEPGRANAFFRKLLDDPQEWRASYLYQVLATKVLERNGRLEAWEREELETLEGAIWR